MVSIGALILGCVISYFIGLIIGIMLGRIKPVTFKDGTDK